MKQLQAGQPVTADGQRASRELLEVLQEMQRLIAELEARIAALEAA